MISSIITERERKIIEKRLKGVSLTQNESNILSKSIRSKLRDISRINSLMLLNKLEYNQKGKSVEGKIKKIVLNNVKNTKSIILYGSAIQTNYKDYNDLDVLVITNRKEWTTMETKYGLILKITEIAKNEGLNLDIQVIDARSFEVQYPHNPSLIYQLKDSKVIYGNIKIPSRIDLSKLDLRMKLDWSDIDDESSSSRELYNSLRNVVLVRLLINGVIDNESLRLEVNKELGERIIARLKDGTASRLERKLVLNYIRKLSEETDKEIKEGKWERIVL